MKIEEMFEAFGCDTASRMGGIFTSLFILQNRMQTACEKLQTEISMKQWLLLAMLGVCPQPHTLTNVGSLMGCSRQNVKKLVSALEKKGFVRLTAGTQNAVHVELTEEIHRYMESISTRHTKALALLFEDFSEEEIEQLFRLYTKLYAGVSRVEEYAEEF